MRIHRGTRGFTLVEIMIVVAIIGLLAAIAVPNFVQARNNARKNACINNLRLLQAAKDQYAIENNQSDTMTPGNGDISPYFKSTQLGTDGLPKEPTGGAYDPGAVNAVATCDVASSLNHSI